jgi:hypothetical protein
MGRRGIPDDLKARRPALAKCHFSCGVRETVLSRPTPTHSQLARMAQKLYWRHTNPTYYRVCFNQCKKKVIEQLIELYNGYRRTKSFQRPPTPTKKILRGEELDSYRQRIQTFYFYLGIPLHTTDLNVPQLEALTNYLANITNPSDSIYEANFQASTHKLTSVEQQIIGRLSDYTCKELYPVRTIRIPRHEQEKLLSFLKTHRPKKQIRPPLPKHKKLFLEDYYQYRHRAQEFFDKHGCRVNANTLNLSHIESILNFIADRKQPSIDAYERIFSANRLLPVDFFIKKYKPFENDRYPISKGQYHGNKNLLTPLLYITPLPSVSRWFAPPRTTKLKKGRNRLFLNYKVMFERLNLPVDPNCLPIAYIEAILNYSACHQNERPNTTKRNQMVG